MKWDRPNTSSSESWNRRREANGLWARKFTWSTGWRRSIRTGMIIPLDDCVCMCSTMYRISPQHLCWTLESLVDGEVVNQVEVDPETKRWARVALERMLEIS